MKKFLVIISVLCTTSVSGQLCGGSIFGISFYLPNGEKSHIIKYELLPITFEQFDTMLLKSKLPRQEQVYLKNKVYKGVLLDSSYVSIDNYVKLHRPVSLDSLFGNRFTVEAVNRNAERFNLKKVELAGTIEGSSIIFPTTETNDNLFLIKFVSKEKACYLVAPLFGGCGTSIDLFWDNYYGFRKLNVCL